MEPVITKHIQTTAGVCGGKPCIAGTRIRVQDIVIWTEKGQSPEEVITGFPQLTLADVHAALAYYHDNRDEIERQMQDGEALAEAMRAKGGPDIIDLTPDKDVDADSVSS